MNRRDHPRPSLHLHARSEPTALGDLRVLLAAEDGVERWSARIVVMKNDFVCSFTVTEPP